MSHLRRKQRTPANIPDISPLVRQWILRILVPLNGINEFVQRDGFRSVALAWALGLAQSLDADDEAFDRTAVIMLIRRMHRVAEASNATGRDLLLWGNIEKLGVVVDLTLLEQRVLEFAVLLSTDTLLNNACDLLGELSSSKTCQAVAGLLSVHERDVRAALSGQSTLSRSGLLTLNCEGKWTLGDKLNLLSGAFADQLMTTDSDPILLLRDTVQCGRAPTLDLTSFPHIAASLALLRPYLATALRERRAGVNVFIYGAPGTGKTELARILSQDAGASLYEIGSQTAEGEPLTGAGRLCAYRATQCFFAKRSVLLLFDEVEDIFNDSGSQFGMSTAHNRKGWLNRALEYNPVPTFWLSNQADCLDPAFIRRFDIVVELPVPPKAQRARILETVCEGLLEPNAILQLATAKHLAPAIVSRAASVVRKLQPALTLTHSSTAIGHLINSTLQAQGHLPIAKCEPTAAYDPAFIQADADLEAIAHQLTKVRSGRLCLYGPPGTGKTAYAQWLADTMDIALLTKRASDLLSPYVGGSEALVAAAFAEAKKEDALLLIDEVDSFLQDRRGAKRGWEISLVNEMLTQMEAFEGVFIASTNLMAGLDQASLRRFDLKVKFDFLRPAQAGRMLETACRALLLPAPCLQARIALARLDRLTPGDFAAVLRQHRFRPLPSASGFVAALASEAAHKEGGKRAIGFV